MVSQGERDLYVEEWALSRLAHLYAHAMDSDVPDIIKKIFTEDAVIESDLHTQRGMAEILAIPAFLKKLFAGTMHTVFNQTFTITGDTATGETYGVAHQLLKPKDGKQMRLDWGIRYQNKYRRENGAWKFTHRRLNVEWTETVPVTMLKDAGPRQ